MNPLTKVDGATGCSRNESSCTLCKCSSSSHSAQNVQSDFLPSPGGDLRPEDRNDLRVAVLRGAASLLLLLLLSPLKLGSDAAEALPLDEADGEDARLLAAFSA
eukprot:scaffold1690_cov182-Amphora_coffeaeformis.AAC.45